MTRQVYIVGGAIRNALMGLPINDMDYVVVGATPEEMLAEGYQQVGADFPVFLKDGCEYALARTERKIGRGYHGFDVDASPEITLEQDLLRRDLTVNAMAVRVDRWEEFLDNDCDMTFLEDPYGGWEDIQGGHVRPVQLETFVEDPLRVLRAARFAATYDMDWTREMREAAAVVLKSNELATIPNERWVLEIEKALKQCKTDGAVSRFAAYLYQLRPMYSATADYVVNNVLRDAAETKTSYAAKLLALCPDSSLGERVRDVFGISNVMADQIGVARDLEILTLQLMVGTNEVGPMYNRDAGVTSLMSLHHRLSSGKTGVDRAFADPFLKELERGDLAMHLLDQTARIFKEVTFNTVTMPPGTQPNMYGRVIYLERERAVLKMMAKENPV